MFKRILFPTDQAAHSHKAQEFAMDLAEKYNSEIIILNVFKLSRQLYTAESIYYMYLDDIENKTAELRRMFLEKIEQEAKSRNIKVSLTVEEGSPGTIIVDTANKENCDLIVMGTRGLNALERTLIGSVSNYVIHHSKCPVMLIN